MRDGLARIPVRLLAGGFLSAALFLASPAHANASSLLWGVEDGEPAHIEIVDGGTYQITFGQSAPISLATSFGPSPFGNLYRIVETEEGVVRELLTTVYPHREGGDAEFAWIEAGSYELDILTPVFPPPPDQQVFDRGALGRLALTLFARTAEAAIIRPPEEERIREVMHFTVEETSQGCAEQCFSNVLFLPGIESSRLYRPDYSGGTERLWEPGKNQDVEDLFLTSDGAGIRSDVYAKEGDVVDELPIVGKNIYKSFIADMNALKSSGHISDWQAISYDWRLSLDDVLRYGNEIDGRIYYAGDLRATSTPYIIQEVRRLAATSKSGRVTIVAHSNGGLVAKYLTVVLGDEADDLIDKMIFVAVPQVGTPMAIAAGLHGYDQENAFGLITSESTARSFASTSPMFYHLLPSEAYLDAVDTPVVSFDDELPDWVDRYGASVSSQLSLDHFLTDEYGRIDSADGNTDQPIRLSPDLLAEAKAIHATLDSWQQPAGVELIQIAGWGVPKTVSGVTYKKTSSGDVQPEPDFTIDGDGTVVTPSALWTNNSSKKKYWLNLRSYNTDHPFQVSLGLNPLKHSNILEASNLIAFIVDVLKEDQKEISEYGYFSTVAPPAGTNRLRFSLHSPLTLDIYDDFGNHTGVSTTTGQIEEQIPGTYYVQFGDIKYIFTDTGNPLHIVMTGYDAGAFTFQIGQLLGDSTVASTTFSNVPTSPSTIAYFNVSSDVTTSSNLFVDSDGDGAFDSAYASSTGQLIVEEESSSSGSSDAPAANGPVAGSIDGQVLGASTSATTSEAATTTAIPEFMDVVAISSSSTISEAISTPPPKKTPRKPSPSKGTDFQTTVASSTGAAPAQPTEPNLWSRMFRWIIKKLSL